jgi:hypothetical protein
LNQGSECHGCVTKVDKTGEKVCKRETFATSRAPIRERIGLMPPSAGFRPTAPGPTAPE